MKHTDPRYGTEEHMKALWEPNKRSNIDDKADAVYKADGTLTHFTSGPRPEIPMSREEDSQFAIKTTKETAT